MDSKRKEQKGSGGHGGPKPGDFRLCSMESRAAARAQLDRASQEKKPMFRLFQDGVLIEEHEHNWDLEGDFTLWINNIGRCAEERMELLVEDRSVSGEQKEFRTHSDRPRNTPNEEAALEAAREARVIEYGKYIAARHRPRRRGYQRRFR